MKRIRNIENELLYCCLQAIGYKKDFFFTTFNYQHFSNLQDCLPLRFHGKQPY